MKKKQYIRFLYGLGLLGMAAMLLSMVPSQSWADANCLIFENTPYNSIEDQGGADTDRDGFSDYLECRYRDSVDVFHYSGNGEEVDKSSVVMHPNEPDLFVAIVEEDPNNYPAPPNLLGYTEQQLGIFIHEVDPNLVRDIEDSSSPIYLQVFEDQPQKAVKLTLSILMPTLENGDTWTGDCAATPPVLVVGTGNVGTPMDRGAFAKVFIKRIYHKVDCLYQQTEQNDQFAMETSRDNYIKHTAVHEIQHNTSLRYLCLDRYDEACEKVWRTHQKIYDTYKNHYPAKDETIMSEKVVGSVNNKGVLTLPIGNTFMPEDQEDALGHLTTLPTPGDS